MADGRLPLAEQRGYKNVFNAIYRISTEESLLTLWKVKQKNFIINNSKYSQLK